jgi:hypothetical protein
VLGFDLERRCRERGIGIAARLRRRGKAGLQPARLVGPVQVGEQMGVVRIDRVGHVDQAGRMARRFEGLRDHERNRLAAVDDAGIVQRLERRALGGRHVLVHQAQ